MRMTALMVSALGPILVGAIGGVAAFSQGPGSRGVASRPLVTRAEYERWQTDLSNWGRWGNNDELGTLNLITPAKRKQAASLVREGLGVSCARTIDYQPAVDNQAPARPFMLGSGE